jgi:hypothetical protein
MPQIFSTDRLLMAAHNMNDALTHPCPGAPFALTTLAAIFKNKLKKPLAPEIMESPVKAAENKRPEVLIHPVLTSPVKHNYHTRSQTEVNHTAPANDI